MTITLRQLRHFEAIYRLASFVRAAEEQRVTQPALTKSLQSFESELGNLVFDRTTRSVEPTEFGHIMVRHARRILAEADSMRDEAMLYQGQQIGKVVLGCGPYPAHPLMTGALRTFATLFPGIIVSIVPGDPQSLLESLVNRKLDLIVCDVSKYETSAFSEAISAERLASDEIVTVFRAGQMSISSADGSDRTEQTLRIASPKPSPHFLRLLSENQRLAELRGEYPHYECESTTACLQLARADGVLAVVPKACAVEACATGELEWRSLSRPLQTNDAVHYLGSHTLGPSVRSLIDIIKGEAQRISDAMNAISSVGN